jgi:hypothetical protein
MPDYDSGPDTTPNTMPLGARDYEGRSLMPGQRVELHPGTDYWARGARFGMVRAVWVQNQRWVVTVKLDKVRSAKVFPADFVRVVP